MNYKAKRLASAKIGRKLGAAVATAALVGPSVLPALQPMVALADENVWTRVDSKTYKYGNYKLTADAHITLTYIEGEDEDPDTIKATAEQGYYIVDGANTVPNVTVSPLTADRALKSVEIAGLYDVTDTEAGREPIGNPGGREVQISDGAKAMAFEYKDLEKTKTGTIKTGAGVTASYDGNAVTVRVADASATLQEYKNAGTDQTADTDDDVYEDVEGNVAIVNLALLENGTRTFRVKPGDGKTFSVWNVNYHANGGKVILADKNVSAKNTVKNVEATVDGKMFLGWATTEDGLTEDGKTSTIVPDGATYGSIFGTNEAKTTVDSQEQHLYAQFGTKYQISFDLNGGALSKSVPSMYKDGESLRDFGNTSSEVDMYLFAADGGHVYIGMNTEIGTLLDIVERHVYNRDANGNPLAFAGWAVDGEFVDETDDITEDMISGGKVTLVAQWSPIDLSDVAVSWTVSSDVEGWDSDNAAVAADVADKGNTNYKTLDKVSGKAPTATHEVTVDETTGYAFWGWNTAADGSGYGFKDGEGFSAADALAIARSGKAKITLYAQWKPAYSIVLDSNVEDGGNAVSGKSVQVSTWLETATADDPTTADVDETYAGDQIVAFVGEALDLPTWLTGKKEADGYTNFNTAAFGNDFYYLGRNQATAHSKKLAGWATTAKGDAVLADGGATTSEIDALRSAAKKFRVTLYARWNDEATYTVTFHPNFADAEDVKSVVLTAGGSARKLDAGASFKQEGFKLASWNTALDGTGTSLPVGFNQDAALDALGAEAVANNLQLFAQWEEAVEVTFKANGGFGDDVVMELSEGQGLPNGASMFSWAGKKFAGWALDADGEEKVSTYAEAAEAAEEGAVTLYATWADDTVDPEPEPVKLGWYKDAEGDWHYLKAVDGSGQGVDKVGWHQEANGDWYHFGMDGKMTKGWLNWAPTNKWYYFGSNGVMVRSMGLLLNNHWYWFKADGTAAQNETINGSYFYNWKGWWTAWEAAK